MDSKKYGKPFSMLPAIPIGHSEEREGAQDSILKTSQLIRLAQGAGLEAEGSGTHLGGFAG